VAVPLGCWTDAIHKYEEKRSLSRSLKYSLGIPVDPHGTVTGAFPLVLLTRDRAAYARVNAITTRLELVVREECGAREIR
jgi:hypothetical protein